MPVSVICWHVFVTYAWNICPHMFLMYKRTINKCDEHLYTCHICMDHMLWALACTYMLCYVCPVNQWQGCHGRLQGRAVLFAVLCISLILSVAHWCSWDAGLCGVYLDSWVIGQESLAKAVLGLCSLHCLQPLKSMLPGELAVVETGVSPRHRRGHSMA